MGISISHSEGSLVTGKVRESRRVMQKEVAATEIMIAQSNKYSTLVIKESSHSAQGDCFGVDDNYRKNSKAEHKENNNKAQSQQKKADSMSCKKITKQTKPTIQSIQTINSSQQLFNQKLVHHQQVLNKQGQSPGQEFEQNSSQIIEQAFLQSIVKQQRRQGKQFREAYIVDLKRTPLKTWRQYVQKPPLQDGKEEFNIQMKQVSFGLYTRKPQINSGMEEYSKSQNLMPFTYVISKKMTEQSSNSKQEQDSLKSMKQAMRQLISDKLNRHNQNQKSKLQHQNKPCQKF